MPDSVAAVVVLDPKVHAQATALAKRLGLHCIDGCSVATARAKERQRFFADLVGGDAGYLFLWDASGLNLHALGGLDLCIRADFYGASVTYRRLNGGGRGQMIAKAVGFKGDEAPRVLDCTAGLGGDAFVLASLGCEVTMLERVPVIRELLRAGLSQAREQADRGLDQILDRLQVVESDALRHLTQIQDDSRPDVVYLDPMFPERSKSALVKKEMRVFHSLVGDDPDADALLPLALDCARKRVVVKRPRIAPTLGSRKPSHVLEGKRNRYDIYVAN